MRVVIYARVSTLGQTVENQLIDLRRFATNSNYEIVEEVLDEGISGSMGRDDRPGLNRLYRLIEEKSVDMILSWSVDRIGRSMPHLVQFLTHLQENNVDLYCHKEQLNTATPAGRMLFNIFSATAEYEREMIRDRIKSGISRAKSQGSKFGRPRIIDNDTREIIVELYSQPGATVRSVAKTVNIGRGSVWRIVQQSKSKKAIDNSVTTV
jgi:DNA invertase Pin-like site-specific DNA recombinase